MGNGVSSTVSDMANIDARGRAYDKCIKMAEKNSNGNIDNYVLQCKKCETILENTTFEKHRTK